MHGKVYKHLFSQDTFEYGYVAIDKSKYKFIFRDYYADSFKLYDFCTSSKGSFYNGKFFPQIDTGEPAEYRMNCRIKTTDDFSSIWIDMKDSDHSTIVAPAKNRNEADEVLKELELYSE